MITLKLNLTAFKHALMEGKTEGEVVLCIPIKLNKLFLSEKRNVYLDIVGFEYKDNSDSKYPNTHILKQSFSKDELSAMTDEQKKELPIIGNARVSGSGQHEEPEPNAVSNKIAKGIDELPF